MKIIALILLVMIFSVSCTVSKVKPPEIKPAEATVHKDCNMCHLPHKTGGKTLLNKPVIELCLSCHPERKGVREHKVGIKPSMPVEDLPLDADGKMTCITCHDPHGKQGFETLLRAPGFNAICMKCHKRY